MPAEPQGLAATKTTLPGVPWSQRDLRQKEPHLPASCASGEAPRGASLTSPSQSSPTLKKMELVGGAETEIRALKPCLLRRNHSREQHGVAASCLEELRSKGWRGTRAGAVGGRGEGCGGPGPVRRWGRAKAGSAGATWDANNSRGHSDGQVSRR